MDLSILVQLSELAYVLKNAKAAETLAKRGRVDAEEQIAALIPTENIGQKTITLSDGVKITVKRGLNYKADCEAIEDVFIEDKTGKFFAPIKTKTTRELDVKGYEWYRINDSETFSAMSQHVTVTPKKVAITLVVK